MRFIERFEGDALIIVTVPLEDKYLAFHVASFLSMHSTIKQREAILGLQPKAWLTHEVEYQVSSCQLILHLEKKKINPETASNTNQPLAWTKIIQVSKHWLIIDKILLPFSSFEIKLNFEMPISWLFRLRFVCYFFQNAYYLIFIVFL